MAELIQNDATTHYDATTHHDATTHYYASLGRLVAAFSELEECLHYAVVALAEADWVKQSILVNRLPLRDRVAMIYPLTVLSTSDESCRDRMDRLSTELKRLLDERDEVMDGYHLPAENASAAAPLHEGRLDRSSTSRSGATASVDDLGAITGAMWEAHQELALLISEMYDAGDLTDAEGELRSAFARRRGD